MMQKVKFDYSALRGRIIQVFKSQQEFAKQMGLSTRTLSLKLNNKVAFNQQEIIRAANLLALGDSMIEPYFFNIGVQEFEQIM